MKDQEKSKPHLIKDLMALRERTQQLESQRRRVEEALKESQQQLHQAQKMETLGTLVAVWPNPETARRTASLKLGKDMVAVR